MLGRWWDKSADVLHTINPANRRQCERCHRYFQQLLLQTHSFIDCEPDVPSLRTTQWGSRRNRQRAYTVRRNGAVRRSSITNPELSSGANIAQAPPKCGSKAPTIGSATTASRDCFRCLVIMQNNRKSTVSTDPLNAVNRGA